MNVADEILELLESSGAPLSGEEMARQLGVSRNAVWKAVQRLREDGYQIEAATNRGYQLVSADNALTPQSVRRLLEGPAQSCAIEVRDSVTSTNTVLKSIAEQGGAEGMALIAQQQTQGKGRLGRSFLSPKGTGLYLSVLLRPRFPAEEALSITTAAAVAVAETIDQLTGQQAKIKWVNDVYLRGRKVCGILTEEKPVLLDLSAARAVEEDCGELSDRLLIREVCATEEGVILLVDVPATLEGLAAGQ